MRISLIDRIGFGNAGAVANAGRDAMRRRLEDEAIERLVAALSERDAASPAGMYVASGARPQAVQRVS